ncbi:MAG TPA: TIGR03618 family F420-dependent PPOX class oxidoreductase [Dehalococcoidia bacterium]|nr:TIGR03618 family F420-dependent PPOX class oxidoreductase [Dehalococcoidia bacterium]
MELIRRLAVADRGYAVVTTLRRDGSMQATLVNAGLFQEPGTDRPTVAFVARGGTVKLRNLRRDPRATVVFRAGPRWVTVEGRATLIGPDDPHPAVPPADLPRLLRSVFTAAGGTHDNWEEYDRVMAEERRTVVLIGLDRVYTNP